MAATIADYLRHWHLSADGPACTTATSLLCPVRWRGRAAWLKVALAAEERSGNQLMRWWNGVGAAEVYECDERAIVLERAVRCDRLVAMAHAGGAADDEASRILATTARRLHAARPGGDRPSLVPLTEWFVELFQHADDVAGYYADAARLAGELLADQREICVLHGDLHHENVLDFGARGWLAIDPKGLVGDRAFDYSNMLCNPLGEVPTRPGRLDRQLRVIGEVAELSVDRLARWTAAWCGLSAAWIERDPDCGEDPSSTLAIGRAALAMLG